MRNVRVGAPVHVYTTRNSDLGNEDATFLGATPGGIEVHCAGDEDGLITFYPWASVAALEYPEPSDTAVGEG